MDVHRKVMVLNNDIVAPINGFFQVGENDSL